MLRLYLTIFVCLCSYGYSMPPVPNPKAVTTTTTHSTTRVLSTTTRQQSTTPSEQCVGDICTIHTTRGQSGHFNSAGWPTTPYRPSQKKRWILMTQDGDEYQLNFGTPFDLEKGSSGTCYDYVQFIDGAKYGSQAGSPCSGGAPILFTKFCGSTVPKNMTVVTKTLYVEFCSDSSIEKTGFQLNWHDEVAPPTTTRGPRTTPKPGSCGKQSDRFPPTNLRIVGGQHANPHSWPWTVALFKGSSSFSYQFCGGSLISSRWAISAGHCFKGQDVSTVHVKIGADNKGTGYQQNEDNQQVVGIAEAFVHPEFTQAKLSHDITLLKLDTDVTINDYVRPICVAATTDVTLMKNKTDVIVAGWGTTTEGGTDSDILMQVKVPILDNAACNIEYPGRIDDTMLCAGLDEGGKDSCQGDSGGPLMFKNPSDNQWYLEGIVSWGRGCAEAHYAGVYSRVSALREWIDETIENNS